MSAVMLLPGTKGSLLLVQRTVTRTIVLQEIIGKATGAPGTRQLPLSAPPRKENSPHDTSEQQSHKPTLHQLGTAVDKGMNYQEIGNHTKVTEFILVGLSRHPTSQSVVFWTLMFLYIATLAGNSLIIFLVGGIDSLEPWILVWDFCDCQLQGKEGNSSQALTCVLWFGAGYEVQVYENP
ncbi:hypothetical protein STEG23_020732 [Scotinomys teguina]